MSAAQQQKIRRIVWTGAIASVTATGAWYGAGLKTTSEMKQVSLLPLFNMHNYHFLIVVMKFKNFR